VSKWPAKPLGEVCCVFSDGDWIESKDQAVGGVRLIQTGNVGEGRFLDRPGRARYVSEDTFQRLSCTSVLPGDCLVSRLPEPIGRACEVPPCDTPMLTAVDCTIARFDPAVMLPRFFTYYSQSHMYLAQVDAQTTGTTRKRISRSKLGQIGVPLPPLPEQQRIAAILDEAFAEIAAATANAEENLLNADALYDSYLDSLFLRRGPEWAESQQTLEELCDLIVDCEHKTAPTQAKGIPSIRTPNVGRGKLILKGVNRVSDATYADWTRRAVPAAGDLILAREAPAGNVAVIPEDTPLCLGQRTVLLRPNRNVFEPAFLALLLLQPEAQSKLLAHSRGATVQHVNLKDIRAFAVGAIPPLATQRRIVTEAADAEGEVSRLSGASSRKLALLDELKRSLLREAFSGNL
jgi:type I restriction enzyme, S subunit